MSETPLSLVSTARQSCGCLDAARIEAFVRSAICENGGFRGKGTAPDLYYGAFGAMCLVSLGCTSPPPNWAKHLEGFRPEKLDLVHLCSLARCLSLYAAVPPESVDAISGCLEKRRREDGGYALRDSAARSSIYAGFLALQAYLDLGRIPPDAPRILDSMPPLRSRDGGYADIPQLEFGTAPVTAAALVLQVSLDTVPDPTAVDWLAARCEDGGFPASPLAPFPDLLSTATALYALRTAGRSTASFAAASRRFVASHQHENGGFFGHALDPDPDCEHTFYALLALGTLQSEKGSASTTPGLKIQGLEGQP